jgi:hypothetical protein
MQVHLQMLGQQHKWLLLNGAGCGEVQWQLGTLAQPVRKLLQRDPWQSCMLVMRGVLPQRSASISQPRWLPLSWSVLRLRR